MSPIQQLALTPITGSALARLQTIPKVGRSLSASSISSDGSALSTYSRAADDMVDRLAAQNTFATFHLWSAGNVRLNGLDLTLPSAGASELYDIINNDERFEIVNLVYLDQQGGDDWKVEIRRTSFASPPSTPMLSDSE